VVIQYYNDIKKLYLEPLSRGEFGVFSNNLKYIRNKIFGYPSSLLIEPTNICNIDCVMCPCSHKFMTRERGFMRLEDYKKIIDDVSKTVPKIGLFFSGEPFLNSKIYEMIRYAASKNIEVFLSTNANKPFKVKELVESGLDTIIISLDGLSKDTYNKYRVGGDFDKVMTNIRDIGEMKRQLKKSKPTLEIQFIVMKHNQHELPKLKEFKSKYDIDVIFQKTVAIPSWFYEGKDFDDLAEKYLPTITSKRYRKSEKKWKISQPSSLCGFLRKGTISWNGDLHLCCYDLNGKFGLGNVLKTPFLDVWNNKKYKKIREFVKKRELDLCKKCGASMEIGTSF
jgi:radical SAM protein with 4Fe4S-binding SPASM domain